MKLVALPHEYDQLVVSAGFGEGNDVDASSLHLANRADEDSRLFGLTGA